MTGTARYLAEYIPQALAGLTFREDRPLPSAGVLDSFNSGASQLLTARSGWSSTAKINSGDVSLITDATPTSATGSNTPTSPHSNLWATQFAADQEVSFVYASGGTIDDCIIYARADRLNSAGVLNAYGFHVRWNGLGNIIELNGSVLLTFDLPAAPVAGDAFAFQCIGTSLLAWKKPNGGAWKLVASTTDATISAAGYVGLLTLANSPTPIDSFSGGAVVPVGGVGTSTFLLNRRENMTFTSAGVGTSGFAFPARRPYGLAWNADALNNREIGSSSNRKLGLRFRAPVSANLNSISLAIAYGSGYSAGTGGSVKAALQADDGTASHFPSGTDLTSVTVSTPVGTPGTESMVTWTFGSPQAVTKGTLYHVVFSNADASPTVNWVSYDGTWSTTPTTPMQPTIPDTDWFMNLKDGASAWFADPSTSPTPVNLHFSDGTDFGQSVDYTPVVAALRNVGGANRVRETFVSAVTALFTGLKVRLYRQSGTTVDLTVDLKENGVVIATANVPAASIVAKAAGSNPADGTWVGITASIVLAAGRTYTIELSAPTETTHYQAYPLRTAIDANFSGAAKANRFTEGVWEYSTNSGGAWSKELGEDDYKMQAYFAVPAPVTGEMTFTSTGTSTSTFTLNRLRPLTFSSAGTSASTFTLNRRRPLTFTSTGTSASTFALNRAKPLTFSSTGTSTSTFTLNRLRPLTFTSTGTSTSTFTLNRRRPLTFSSTGVGTSTFTLNRLRPLTFSSAGTSTSTFTLNRRRPLTFTSTGTSTSTFVLSRVRPLTFTSTGTSTSTFGLNRLRPLTFTSTGIGTSTFNLSTHLRQMTFTSAGVGTSTFTLNTRRALTFTSTGTSTSTFSLNRRRPLTFSSAGTSTSSFTLNRYEGLTFTSTGTSTSTFSLNRRENMTFTSNGVGTSTFSLVVKRALTFTSAGVGTSTFDINIPGSHLRQLSFTSTGVGTSTFSLARLRPLTFSSAGTSTSTFTLRRLRPLTFSSAGTSTSSFSLRLLRGLTFSSAGVGTSTFALTAKRALTFNSTGVGTSTFTLSRRRALSFVSSGVGTSTFALTRLRPLGFVSSGLSASTFTLTRRRSMTFTSFGTSTSTFALVSLHQGTPVVTSIIVCEDPRAEVLDCPSPDDAETMFVALAPGDMLAPDTQLGPGGIPRPKPRPVAPNPDGVILSNPQPGEVG